MNRRSLLRPVREQDDYPTSDGRPVAEADRLRREIEELRRRLGEYK